MCLTVCGMQGAVWFGAHTCMQQHGQRDAQQLAPLVIFGCNYELCHFLLRPHLSGAAWSAQRAAAGPTAGSSARRDASRSAAPPQSPPRPGWAARAKCPAAPPGCPPPCSESAVEHHTHCRKDRQQPAQGDGVSGPLRVQRICQQPQSQVNKSAHTRQRQGAEKFRRT